MKVADILAIKGSAVILNFRVDQLQRETGLLRAFASQTDREPQDR